MTARAVPIPSATGAPELADLSADLTALRHRVEHGARNTLGYPLAVDIDFTELAAWTGLALNNVGDPAHDPRFGWHSRDQERIVLDELSDLFGLSRANRWGYITTGGTEGVLCGLRLGRAQHPDAVVYYSETAHYSVAKSAELLGLATAEVASLPGGAIDTADFARRLREHRGRPALVVATVGTTMTEAVDDVTAIRAALDAAGSPAWVHVDAALSGIPLALDADESPPPFGFVGPGRGADSLSVSGHKFLAVPFPCGAVLARTTTPDMLHRVVSYIGAADTTITSSRSGHSALWMWYSLRRYGRTGHRYRTDRAREVAQYAVDRLTAIGRRAWRHPHAFTVVFPTVPEPVVRRWSLAVDGPVCHLICMPGVTATRIDRFIEDLAELPVGPPTEE